MTSRVVCGVGVPHVPVFPQLAAQGDEDIWRRYAAVRRVLERSDPSLLLIVANDHLNTFFLDRLPTFAITLGDSLPGPIDDVPGLSLAPIRTAPDAAATLAEALVPAGYDLTLCREVAVDHSVVVPLHFLNPRSIPVVVLYINGYVPPLPSAQRCHRLGVVLADVITRLPGEQRVAIVASGSFSHEVGGPRLDPGRTWSVPRPDWAARVAAALAADDVAGVLDAATPEMLADAGSVAGEVLSWFVTAGAVGAHGVGLDPTIEYRPGEAFAFGAWSRG